MNLVKNHYYMRQLHRITYNNFYLNWNTLHRNILIKRFAFSHEIWIFTNCKIYDISWIRPAVIFDFLHKFTSDFAFYKTFRICQENECSNKKSWEIWIYLKHIQVNASFYFPFININISIYYLNDTITIHCNGILRKTVFWQVTKTIP